MIKESWKTLGYIDEPVPTDIDLPAAIRQLCKEKNAIILAHYYTDKSLQDIADFIGDSLALARMQKSSSCVVFTLWVKPTRYCVLTRKCSFLI